MTEVQKLKADNFDLKVKAAQCMATLTDRENRLLSIDLTVEQKALTEEFRKQLGAKDEEVFDWNTRSFKPAPPK